MASFYYVDREKRQKVANGLKRKKRSLPLHALDREMAAKKRVKGHNAQGGGGGRRGNGQQETASWECQGKWAVREERLLYRWQWALRKNERIAPTRIGLYQRLQVRGERASTKKRPVE